MTIVRHPLPETVWPTREAARDALLFRPIRLGPLHARTRTWVPAMVPWRATEDGEVTDAALEWYERFARGKPGVLVVEATGIRDVPSGPLLRIGHDRFIPGLRDLVRGNRPFLFLWSSQLLAATASGIGAVVKPLYLLDHASAAAVGYYLSATTLSTLIALPLGGALADRFSRVLLIRVSFLV